MKKHTIIYYKYFDYPATPSFVPCEVCGSPAVDIHHIKPKGMGGSHNQDRIENLMALCREHHIQLGDKKQYLTFLKAVHAEFMEVPYSFVEKYGQRITQKYIDNPNERML